MADELETEESIGTEDAERSGVPAEPESADGSEPGNDTAPVSGSDPALERIQEQQAELDKLRKRNARLKAIVSGRRKQKLDKSAPIAENEADTDMFSRALRWLTE